MTIFRFIFLPIIFGHCLGNATIKSSSVEKVPSTNYVNIKAHVSIPSPVEQDNSNKIWKRIKNLLLGRETWTLRVVDQNNGKVYFEEKYQSKAFPSFNIHTSIPVTPVLGYNIKVHVEAIKDGTWLEEVKLLADVSAESDKNKKGKLFSKFSVDTNEQLEIQEGITSKVVVYEGTPTKSDMKVF